MALNQLRNAWNTAVPLELTQQRLLLFLQQNGMMVVSMEGGCYTIRSAEPQADGSFPLQAVIQLAAAGTGTYIDATVADASSVAELDPATQEARMLYIKNWMWSLYNSLPAAPVPQPVLQPPAQPGPEVWNAASGNTVYTPQPDGGQPYQQPYQSPMFMPKPPKDRSLAMILEIIPDLFGIYGIGWIYSGNTSTGLAWLIGGLVWLGFAVLLVVFTGGIATLCTLPMNILLTVLSATRLNTYTKVHPEIFGPA